MASSRSIQDTANKVAEGHGDPNQSEADVLSTLVMQGHGSSSTEAAPVYAHLFAFVFRLLPKPSSPQDPGAMFREFRQRSMRMAADNKAFLSCPIFLKTESEPGISIFCAMIKRSQLLFLFLACGSVASAQSTQETTFAGQPATLLSNDKLQVTIMTQGGAIASVVLADDAKKQNPMWSGAARAARRHLHRHPRALCRRGWLWPTVGRGARCGTAAARGSPHHQAEGHFVEG